MTPFNRSWRRILEFRLSEENPGFISVVAMVETVWVLGRPTAWRQRVCGCPRECAPSRPLVVEHEQEVFTAMIALKDGRGSFADALIATLGARAGCTHTLTFDRQALRLPGFELANSNPR